VIRISSVGFAVALSGLPIPSRELAHVARAEGLGDLSLRENEAMR